MCILISSLYSTNITFHKGLSIAEFRNWIRDWTHRRIYQNGFSSIPIRIKRLRGMYLLARLAFSRHAARTVYVTCVASLLCLPHVSAAHCVSSDFSIKCPTHPRPGLFPSHLHVALPFSSLRLSFSFALRGANREWTAAQFQEFKNGKEFLEKGRKGRRRRGGDEEETKRRLVHSVTCREKEKER